MMKMLSLCLLLVPVIVFAQSNYQKSSDQLKPLKIADEVVFNLSSLHPYNTTQQEGVVFEKHSSGQVHPTSRSILKILIWHLATM